MYIYTLALVEICQVLHSQIRINCKLVQGAGPIILKRTFPTKYSGIIRKHH